MRPALALTLLLLLPALSACGPAAQLGLSPALTQRMDAPGARLDPAGALDIVNAFRRSVGVAALSFDAGLSASASTLAAGYARSGTPPKAPAGVAAKRVSAGYPTFADTFSGWRNSPDDARVLARATARRAGIGVVSDPGTTYGIYWVLLLAD